MKIWNVLIEKAGKQIWVDEIYHEDENHAIACAVREFAPCTFVKTEKVAG